MKVKTDEKPTDFEALFVELINKGYDVSLQNDQDEMYLWLDNVALYLGKNGKWRIE